MGEHLYTYINPPAEKHLARAIRVLEHDGVLALPSGTNWNFACDAASVKALDKIRMLNPRHPKDRPFSLLCGDISMAATVGSVDNNLYRILKKVWPGPYTVIVKRNRTLPRQIKDKRPVVGIRIPDSPLVLALIEQYGKPLATTSIPNKPDETPYHMGYEVFEFFGHAVDLTLDLGDELPGSESTVIDFSEGVPEVVRVGAGDPDIFLKALG